MSELKRLPTGDDREFIANGNKYYISSQLSVKRFHEFQILELEAKMGINIADIGLHLAEIWKMRNSNRIADADVKLFKLIEGIEDAKHREHVLLRMCALFINREGEDLGKIDEDLISQKIDDWAEYDHDDFFTRALNSQSGFLANYNAMLRIISGQAQGEK